MVLIIVAAVAFLLVLRVLKSSKATPEVATDAGAIDAPPPSPAPSGPVVAQQLQAASSTLVSGVRVAVSDTMAEYQDARRAAIIAQITSDPQLMAELVQAQAQAQTSNQEQ